MINSRQPNKTWRERMGVEPTMDAARHPSTDLKLLHKAKLLSSQDLVTRFLTSRRQGLSPQTVRFYRGYLDLSREVVGIGVKPQEIDGFLSRLDCSNGGKHAYYRTLRTFYRWLCSPRSGMGLSLSDNPILGVDPPKVEKKILPAFTVEQVNHLIDQANCVRDKAIISLFADSGLRLSELANVNPRDIDWEQRLMKVTCKGNKQGLAVFGPRTEGLLREWLSQYNPNGTIWDLNRGGIIDMLRRLKSKTGLPCNPHTFRRTFASTLAKKGIDCLHIMRLGRWESISMVERYTRSVKFEDSLKLYRGLEAPSPSKTL